ncbi:MAG: nitroreductase family protein [Candidatus Wallbacteria bacterium]|nr:nitroreductase family protein [Candidatus Wallbacteria bacterium]
MKSRRSVRKFKPDKPPLELIKLAVEAAVAAPSNSNSQPWRFIYLEDATKISALADLVEAAVNKLSQKIEDQEKRGEYSRYATYFSFFRHAPGLIAVACKEANYLNYFLPTELQLVQTVNPELCSVSAAIQNLLLMLHASGLGACWMTGPLIAAREISGYIGLKEPYFLAALIPVGYPAEEPAIPRKKELDKIFVIK